MFLEAAYINSLQRSTVQDLQLPRPDHKQSGILALFLLHSIYLQKANLETTLLLMYTSKNKIAKKNPYIVWIYMLHQKPKAY